MRAPREATLRIRGSCHIGLLSATVTRRRRSPTISAFTIRPGGSGKENGTAMHKNETRPRAPSPTLQDVVALAQDGSENYGVRNSSANPKMVNVIAKASDTTGNDAYGLYSDGTAQTLYISRSTFEGATNSVYNLTDYTVKITKSELYHSPPAGAGTFQCAGVAKAYAPTGSTPPPPPYPYAAADSGCQ